MLKRDEVAIPTSCLNKARDEEWIFILLARDPAAPAAIRAWVAERVRLGKNKITDAQVTSALAAATRMEREAEARVGAEVA